MKSGKFLISIFAFCFCFGGCQKDPLSGSLYVKYVESGSNKLHLNKQTGDLHFDLQYCPTEYLLLKEFKNEPLTLELLESRKKENEGFQFFKLRIMADGCNDVMGYQISDGDQAFDRIQYLSYAFEQDIALVQGIDTIFPALFHFERTYGLVPYADFMMSFNTQIAPDSGFQILIDDKAFNTGLMKFNYASKDLSSIPQLNIL